MSEALSWFQKNGADLAQAEKDFKDSSLGTPSPIEQYTSMLSKETVQVCQRYEQQEKFPYCLCLLPHNTLEKAEALVYIKMEDVPVLGFLVKSKHKKKIEDVRLECMCNHTYAPRWNSAIYKKFIFLVADLKYKNIASQNLIHSLLSIHSTEKEQKEEPLQPVMENIEYPEQPLEEVVAKFIEKEHNSEIKKALARISSTHILTEEDSKLFNTLLRNSRRTPKGV
ncbi:hypothetical protein NECID01_1843 [Nematocida sp. AWRm77]|nr:hypothetical protein NECID01_1843 [Nematocida sp. AWRm77]